MIERRNFYRILYVQPDASMAVIRESYRMLIQKLKTNPVLSSSNWNACLLETAYNTLQDPLKRAVYDRELLKRYHIKTLSQGAFSSNTNVAAGKQKNERATKLNQRNHYRILQIQPDAPIAAITASYHTLKKNPSQDIALLDEAYRILSDPGARRQYDVLFIASNFSHAAEQPAQANTDLIRFLDAENTSQLAVEPYRAAITHYCSFCKTPYMPQTNVYQNENCLECASPLFALQYENHESSRRTMMRINIGGEFMFYLFWPSKPHQALFQDLSPMGVPFFTQQPIDLTDSIKSDAPNVQAVAEVTHQHNESTGISVGTRFIVVKFEQRHGNFITAQA